MKGKDVSQDYRTVTSGSFGSIHRLIHLLENVFNVPVRMLYGSTINSVPNFIKQALVTEVAEADIQISHLYFMSRLPIGMDVATESI
jgi:hypothetical protein